MALELIQIGSKQQTMLTTKMEVHGHEPTLGMPPMSSTGYFMFLLSNPMVSFDKKRAVYLLHKTYEFIAKREKMVSMECFSIT